VSSLAQSVFRAELDARQKLAEAGGRLSLIDPAFRPVTPAGPGKKIFLMAGLVLFLGMGLAIAVLLAVIDDRLYRRSDLDHLGIAVLGVIPPPAKPPEAARTRAASRRRPSPPAERDAA
jgi:capsular polysaccharide biosynthesis protein